MKELQITKINNYEYELKDEKNKIIKMNIEFYDLKEPLKINDKISISKELLDKNYPEYDTFYRFGKLDSIYGRKNSNIDIIEIKTEKELIYLQRYYG